MCWVMRCVISVRKHMELKKKRISIYIRMILLMADHFLGLTGISTGLELDIVDASISKNSTREESPHFLGSTMKISIVDLLKR